MRAEYDFSGGVRGKYAERYGSIEPVNFRRQIMMTEPSRVIGGASVLVYTPVDERHRPTGNCLHTVGGRPIGPAAGLAICQYPGDTGCYLFHCDADWEVAADTWHASVEDAREQAEFEYEGTSATWRRLDR